MDPIDTSTWKPGFRTGMLLPLRGMSALRQQRRAWPWLVVPMVLQLTLIVASIVLALRFGADLSASVEEAAAASSWLSWASGFLAVVSRILLSALLFVVFMVPTFSLTTMLASPAYDRISLLMERSTTAMAGVDDEPFSWRLFATDVGLGITHSLLALILYAALAVPLLVGALIPWPGAIVMSALGYLVSGFFAVRDAIDYSLSRERMAFGAKLRLLWKYRSTTLGMAASCVLLYLFPPLTLLTLPACVAGASLWYVRLKQLEPTTERPLLQAP